MVGWILSFSFLSWGQSGLSIISSHVDFMKAPPLGLFSTQEGRILLLYPRGYVDFSAALETDGKTLLSLWYSDQHSWPAIKQGQLQEGYFFLIDRENRLYQVERETGNWKEIPAPLEDFQRLYFLQADKIALFSRNSWQYFLLKDHWTPIFGPSLSPLAMVTGEVDHTYIVDPLLGVCFSPLEEKIPLNPAPGSSISKGQISGETLWLWSASERLQYNLQGALISRAPTSEGVLNLLLPSEGELIRYNLPSGTLFQNESPFPYTENDWIAFLKEEIPLLLDREDKELLAWLLEQLNETFQSHPLDRELAVLKNEVDSLLQKR